MPPFSSSLVYFWETPGGAATLRLLCAGHDVKLFCRSSGSAAAPSEGDGRLGAISRRSEAEARPHLTDGADHWVLLVDGGGGSRAPEVTVQKIAVR